MIRPIKKLNLKTMLLSTVLFISFLTMNLQSVSAEIPMYYEVDPDDFTVGVTVGDQVTYLFRELQFIDPFGPEMREINLTLPFSGVNESVIVNEGALLTITVIDINDTHITLEHQYEVDGLIYIPDYQYMRRDRLSLFSRYGMGLARWIMTTNTTLIEDNFAGSEWSIEIHDEVDLIRFYYDVTNESFDSFEDHEYDKSTGWLRGIHLHYNDKEGGYATNIEIERVFLINPDHFTTPFAVGENNLYTFTTLNFYDKDSNAWHHDMGWMMTIDGQPEFINIKEGDQMNITITDITDDYIEYTFSIIQDDFVYVDEYLHYINKELFGSHGRMDFFFSPIVMTDNTTLIQEVLGPDFDIKDDLVFFSHETYDNEFEEIFFQEWNLTTGWMTHHYFKHVEKEADGTIRIHDEIEIFDSDYLGSQDENNSSSTYPDSFWTTGVNVDDEMVYTITEGYVIFENGTTANITKMGLMINGTDEIYELQPNDEIVIKITSIDGTRIKFIVIVNSAADNKTITSDEMDFDLSDAFDENVMAPPVITTNSTLVKEIADQYSFLTVSITTDTITLTYEFTDDYSNSKLVSVAVYDAQTGWILSLTMKKYQDGNLVEYMKIETESTPSVGSNDTSSDNLIELTTPLPIMPIFFAIVIVAVFNQKKKKH